MEYKIALIPGDGIGPEIVAEAKKVLDRVCEKYSHKSVSYTHLDVYKRQVLLLPVVFMVLLLI